jgi:putative heme-binding domain-containing protein
MMKIDSLTAAHNVPWRMAISGVIALALTLTLTDQGLKAQTPADQKLSARLRAESPAALAQAAREKGDSARGAAIFPKKVLACAECHVAGSQDQLGPDLTSINGEPLSDEEIVESILEPSKRIRKGFEAATVTTIDGRVLTGRIVERNDDELKIRLNNTKLTSPTGKSLTLKMADVDEAVIQKVSAMPESLVDQLSGRGEFLDLVRYVMQLSAASVGHQPKHPATQPRQLSDRLAGEILIEQHRCVACHAGQRTTGSDEETAGRPLTFGPDLTWVGGNNSPDYIQAFLLAPHELKLGTPMPDLLQNLAPKRRAEVAERLTQFVVSLGEGRFEETPVSSEAAERGQQLFQSIGCVACHAPRTAEDQPLLSESSVSMGKLRGKYSLASLADFLENPHLVRASGRMPNMKLTHWEALDISHYLLSSAGHDQHQANSNSFVPAPDLAKEGAVLFGELNCGSCHTLPGVAARGTMPIAKLGSPRDRESGCLSNDPGDYPRYQLTSQQKQQIEVALGEWDTPLSAEQQIDVTLTSFRCTACHERNSLGGIPEDRDHYFTTANPNLGPQGRIPPSLSGVGTKLNSEWLRQVLVTGRSIRPYMNTRMPQFGEQNIQHLVQLFAAADDLPTSPDPPTGKVGEIRKLATDMIGNQGLNCIACHTFQHKPGQTMPAVDLTEMADRLKKGWFEHYMKDPQRFHRGTVMPTFWPGGNAMRRDFFDGDADQQIEAIWQYLLEGRQARTPRGLVIEPIELVASAEAIMLRRSYPGIGKRGIGVGYPAQINVAFDAEQMRLAMLWKGKFADPGGVWRGQGHGTVRPMERDVHRFELGPDLDDAKNPWIVDPGRPPKHQFRGYYLDILQRPTFLYRFENISVEDFSIDSFRQRGDKPSVSLQRTITFESPAKRAGLRFRIASGKEIKRSDDGVFIVDRKVRIRLSRPDDARVVDGENSQRLEIHWDLPAGKSNWNIRYEL